MSRHSYRPSNLSPFTPAVLGIHTLVAPTASTDARTPLTVADMDNLRHMLGVSDRHPRGYRNHYVASGDDVASMERLRASGLVMKNDPERTGGMPCYHATEQGARFLGLKRLPR